MKHLYFSTNFRQNKLKKRGIAMTTQNMGPGLGKHTGHQVPTKLLKLISMAWYSINMPKLYTMFSHCDTFFIIPVCLDLTIKKILFSTRHSNRGQHLCTFTWMVLFSWLLAVWNWVKDWIQKMTQVRFTKDFLILHMKKECQFLPYCFYCFVGNLLMFLVLLLSR